jgi:hypothetical protein
MSVFKILSMAAGNYAGIKMVQKGADMLINKHTSVSIFQLNSGLRSHADEIVKQYFLNHEGGGQINEHDAALLKLAVFYATAEQSGQEHMAALMADAIANLRDASEGKINPSISMEVLAQTGT